MAQGQFRYAYFTPDYEATVAFFRDGVEFPLVHSWDRAPRDKGTLFAAASGTIEILIAPDADSDHLFDPRPPQGVLMSIEVDDLEARYEAALARGLPIHQPLKDQSWGHRTFCLREPNGLVLYFFRKTY